MSDILQPYVIYICALGQTYAMQVDAINDKIDSAPQDSLLYKLPRVEDPSKDIADVLVKSLEWNMLSREWNLSTSDLSELHLLSKGLLDALNEHLPDRVGGSKGWITYLYLKYSMYIPDDSCACLAGLRRCSISRRHAVEATVFYCFWNQP